MNKINKVCVIGSGVMGSGIASLIASSGTSVLLLDLPSSANSLKGDGNQRNFNQLNGNQLNGNQVNSTLEDRNEILKKALKIIESTITHPIKMQNIEIGNLEDDLKKIKGCDLIIEAIVEKEDLKLKLYDKIYNFMNKDAVLASNTSTIRLSALRKNMPRNLSERFCIIHFFNPPRHMHLVELVSDINTEKDIICFIEETLGKGVIKAKDTAGFIANRVGCFFIEAAIKYGLLYEVDVYKVDHICNKFLGMPSTGVFGLADLIGIDVVNLISKSLVQSLATRDYYKEVQASNIKEIEEMIRGGYVGRKGKGGFYRVKTVEGKKIKEILNLKDFSYYPVTDLGNMSSLTEFLAGNPKEAMFFNKLTEDFGNYIANIKNEIADDEASIEKTMRWGYNWKYSLFKLNAMIKDHSSREEGLKLGHNKQNLEIQNFLEIQNRKEIFSNKSAVLNKHQEILCFELKTKMGALNDEIFESLKEAIDIAEQELKPLIIYNPQNEFNNFSVGADLNKFITYIETKDKKGLDNLLAKGQQAYFKLKYAKVPVIAAVNGYALGGGFELILHSSHLVAGMETYAGLVEASLGLIPGWGGLKEMVMRSNGDMEVLYANLSKICHSFKTPSADYLLQDFKLENTLIVMNKYKILDKAIELAKVLKKDEYAALQSFNKANAQKQRINISKEIAKDLNLKTLSLNILDSVSESLIEGSYTEQSLLDIERELFVKLAFKNEVLDKLKNLV